MDYKLFLRKDKSSYTHYERDALKIRWAHATGHSCELHFEKQEQFYYAHRLKILEDFVKPSALFFRANHSHLLRLSCVVDCLWLEAILDDNSRIPLNPESYEWLKNFLSNREKAA